MSSSRLVYSLWLQRPNEIGGLGKYLVKIDKELSKCYVIFLKKESLVFLSELFELIAQNDKQKISKIEK